MLIRLGKKFKENNGSSYLVLIILIFALFMCVNFVDWIDKDMYTYWVKKCEWGVQSGTKAAMLMLENTQENIKNISEGFLTEDMVYESYNNNIKIEHLQAIEIFFEKYYSSLKNPQIKKEDMSLENSTLIAIVELHNELYNISIYKNRSLIDIYSCNSLVEVEAYINGKLTGIEIFLYNDIDKGIVDLQDRTYFIAVTEDLKLPNLLEEKSINVSYFEGSNIERLIDMRGDN